MKRITLIWILTTLLAWCPLDLFSQYKTFTGINDIQFDYIDGKLEKLGFGKKTYYYNDLTKKDGKWELYPKVLIYDSLFAVSVSTINGLANQYTFIVFYDSKLEQIQDTIGPFFDTHVYAIKFKLRNGQVTHLIVKLTHPPEEFVPKFTLIEYERNNTRLIEIRSYDKY